MAKSKRKKAQKPKTSPPQKKVIGWGIDQAKYDAARKPKPK